MTQPQRILLVEDSPNDAALALAALEETQLAGEVVTVPDGQAALDFLLREGSWAQRPGGHPAVVLLDIKLPKVDGLEVLARVKAHPELKAIPVVMLTSSREEPDVRRAYGLGSNAYVVKPVAFTEFVRALRELGVFWAVINQPPPGSVPRRPQ